MGSENGTNLCERNGSHLLSAEWSIVIQPDSSLPSHNAGNEDEWLKSFDRINDETDPCEMPKIQRVPPMHREIESNRRCYDPLVVSIGPHHHGKPLLHLMEHKKRLLTRRFADKSNTTVAKVHDMVAEMVGRTRECYEEGSVDNFDDKAFSRMMLLDGCFIIEFMDCIVNGPVDDLKMKSHDIAFVRRDLFLLENQIPYEVLKALMSLRFPEGKGGKMIKIFIKRSRAEPQEKLSCIEKIKRLIFMRCSREDDMSSSKPQSRSHPLHLLEKVRKQLIDVSAFGRDGCFLKGEWCSYRSAMELRSVGIHFRPGKACSRLSDISFESTGFSSCLTLPPITIDDSTKSLLLNLVAYEACPDTPDDFGVTSYLSFMDSLIDKAEDVKELRSKGILLNYLGSDQQVADLFNEIAKDLVPNPHAFVRVKDCIEKHYQNNLKLWIAEWKHAHFSSPWTCIAFVAAILALSLSISQTVLGAIQTNLAAHPPKN